MAFYITEKVDIDVKVTEDEIIKAIEKKKIETAKVISIVKAGNDFLRGNGINKTTSRTLWDDEWYQLTMSLKQKFPNPSEFENFLRDNEILYD